MSYNVKLSGVLPALVTPFDANNEIDFGAFENLLNHFRKAGVTGWVPNGSTGEYFSQSTEERRSVLKFVKDFASDDEILIAGTNAPATREVIEQTAMAKEIGYDNVLLAPPFYTRPTQDELIRHYETVLAEVDVNLVLYSYPAKDGADISFELMDHFADNPRVIGIKESSGVLQRAVDISSRYEGKIQLISGSDDIALDFMFWGAESWICGPSNCMAQGLLRTGPRCIRPGELVARQGADEKAVPRDEHSGERQVRAEDQVSAAELQGLDRSGECRAPLGPLTKGGKSRVHRSHATHSGDW